MSYYEKYLKYKIKYTELKKLLGGGYESACIVPISMNCENIKYNQVNNSVCEKLFCISNNITNSTDNIKQLINKNIHNDDPNYHRDLLTIIYENIDMMGPNIPIPDYYKNIFDTLWDLYNNPNNNITRPPCTTHYCYIKQIDEIKEKIK
jgi:hypothetical protein